MLSVGLRQFEYTLAVAEHGSVTAAAEHLHISQPALSAAIAKLEEHLDAPLFIRRKGSPLILTSFGREFVDSASKIFNQIENLVNGKNTPEQRQPIAIGCFEDLGPLVVGALLAEIKSHFPLVNVTIRTGDFDWISAEMRAGRIDFSVTYDLGIDTGLDVREITAIRPRLLIYPDHPYKKRKKIWLKDIAKEALILVDQAHSIGHMINLFRDCQLSPNLVHRAASFEIMRSMVANRLGVGLSYTQSQSGASYDGKPLIVRDIADSLSPEQIVLVSNAKNPLSTAAEELAKHTISLFRLRQL